jgi:hypothetical protein
MLEHLKQHLTLWYLSETDRYASEAYGEGFETHVVKPILREAQQVIAVATQHVLQDAGQKLTQQIGPAIQQMLQLMKQMQSQVQQPTDPNIMAQVNALTQTAMAETNRKAALDQANLQLKAQEQQQDAQQNHDKLVAEQQIEGAKITHDVNMLTIERQFDAQQQVAQYNKELQQQQMEQVAQAQQAQQEAMKQGIAQEGVAEQLNQQGGMPPQPGV